VPYDHSNYTFNHKNGCVLTVNISNLSSTCSSTFSHKNNYSVLSDQSSTSDESGPNRSRQHVNNPPPWSNFKVLYLNCQSIVNKKHEFHILIDTHNPDIVIGTESWLTKEHLTSEIFPSSLGYTIFRRDRQKGKGGGVFILVKLNLYHHLLKVLTPPVKYFGLK